MARVVLLNVENDYELARKIRLTLNERGHNVNAHGPAVVRSRGTMRRAMQNADVMLYLLSPAAVGDSRFMIALEVAQQQTLPSIPVLAALVPDIQQYGDNLIDATTHSHRALYQIAEAVTAHGAERRRIALLWFNSIDRRVAAAALMIVFMLGVGLVLLVANQDRPQVETAALPTDSRAQVIIGDSPVPESTEDAQTQHTDTYPARTATNITQRIPTDTLRGTEQTGDDSALNARFTASTRSGTAPLRVQFNDQSTGPISNYAWDFDGDGSQDSSVGSPAVFSYTEPGSYNATLTVFSASGAQSTYIQSILVAASGDGSTTAPTARFSAAPNSGSAPLTVNFADASSGDIDTYAWDFDGDGVFDSAARNPSSYRYNTPGSYSAQLLVGGPGGISDPFVQVIQVGSPAEETPDEGIIANFSIMPSQGSAPLMVEFLNQSRGEISNYSWDFDGDGQIDSNLQSPQPYTYQNAGTYTVILTVLGTTPDGERIERSAQRTVSVTSSQDNALKAEFSVNTAEGVAPLTVTFSDRSSGNVTSYEWDFNDDGVIDSTEANPAPHTYQQTGAYRARLTVSNGSDIDSRAVIIRVRANDDDDDSLVVSLNAAPTSGIAPLRVFFTPTISGSVLGMEWDFTSDGRVDSTASRPAHVYLYPGVYTVTLLVEGAENVSRVATVQITVNERGQSTATRTPLPGFTTTSQITRTSIFDWPTATASFTPSFVWPTATPIVTATNTPVVTPSITPTPSGSETATPTPSGSETATPTPTANVVILPSATPQVTNTPDVTLTATPTATPEISLTPTFTETLAVSLTPSETLAVSLTPSFTPTFTDVFTPTLTLTPTITPTMTHSATPSLTPTFTPVTPSATFTPAPPQAKFRAFPVSGDAPLPVSFSDQSTGIITEWRWDFDGDGITDLKLPPGGGTPPPLLIQYIYNATGSYQASLVVKGPHGESAPYIVEIVAGGDFVD